MLRRALPHDRSIRLLGAYAGLTTFCAALAFYAIGLLAFVETNSTLVVAAIMAVVTAAEMVGALVGGVLADRMDRKYLAGLATAGSAVLLASLGLPMNLAAATALLVAVVLVASPVLPIIGAALPNLVEESSLEQANGYVQALRNGALALAPACAGLLAGLVGARVVFVVAAVALLLSVLVLRRIRAPFQAAGREVAEEVHASPIAAFREGLEIVRGDAVLVLAALAAFAAVLVSACCIVADLPLALDTFHAGSLGYGLLVATWGLGMVAGSLIAPFVVRRSGSSLVALVTGFAIEGVILALVAGAPAIAPAVALFLVGGVAGGWASVADQLLVQERVPDHARGRVRASFDALITSAYAISIGVGGLVVGVLGPRGTYLVAGVALFAVSAAALALAQRVHRAPAPSY